MSTWQIILTVYGIITLITFLIGVCVLIADWREKRKWNREYLLNLLIGLFLIPLLLGYGLFELSICLENVKKDGGIIRHHKLAKYRKLRAEVEEREREKAKKEYERIRAAFKTGELSRTELPRKEDGETCFEFSPEMGLYSDCHKYPRELVYVESKYNERLNRFFSEHKELRLYRMYRFVYLPSLSRELEDGELLHYQFPYVKANEIPVIELSSTYPMQFLDYAADAAKIKQGMFFFRGDCANHGAEYIAGEYYPLQEGSDEEIIAQLNAIVKGVHGRHGNGGLSCKVERPTTEEGSSNEYADEQFDWVLTDDEVAGLIEDVRKKIARLKEYGIAGHLLLKLLKEKPNLSRLIITKDMRILLPDYNNMEIKMEPINKAVYLLFLRHPEGIIFKHLPDYRKELAEIYRMIKPLGLNERALRSIEDVTNPCLNSINEKCARIRGAFVSQFDEDLASNYYVSGWRGEAKKVSLSRDLVIWE